MNTRGPQFDFDASYNVKILLDADGCVLNPFLDFLKKNLLAKFGNKIWKFSRKEVLSVEEQQAVDSIFAEMTDFLDTLISFNTKENKLQVPNYNQAELQRLSQVILENGGYESDVEEERDTFLTDSLIQFQQALKKLKPEFLKLLLYKANQPLFKEIGSFCQDYGFSKIEVGSFSARQSEQTDDYNSKYHGTGLFSETLPILSDIFNSNLLPFKITCKLDDYVLEKDLQEKFFFDHTKVPTLYAHLNRLSEKTILIIFDDRQDILLGLTQILNCHPRMIFKDDVVLLVEYDGHYRQYHRKYRCEPPEPFIATGLGKQKDENYVHNLLKIQKLWNPDLQSKGDVKHLVNEALARRAIESFLDKRKLNLKNDYHQFFPRKKTLPAPAAPVRKVHASRCTLV